MRALGAAKLFADRFAIEREIGAGTMGTVYRALDRVSGGHVALKVLHAHRAASDVGRFVAELSALAAIEHPAVARYLSHGVTIDNERFVVTEWIDGETLGARIASGPALSVIDVLALAHRLAAGLEAIHAHGLVHGDLRATNVFLGGGAVSQAKLLDFGFRGAPGAPEPGVRADFFSLGTLVVHALTGKDASETPVGPPGWLRAVRSDVPESLEAFVGHLLEKDPEDRPENATFVCEALAVLLREQKPPMDLIAKTLSSMAIGKPVTISSRPVEKEGRADPVGNPIGKEVSPTPPSPGGGGRVTAETEKPDTMRIITPPSPSSGSDRALNSGMIFAGRYLLEARVGVGGMGELFRAFDTRLRRTVALKVLHRERAISAPSESSARILREARAAASLSHSNVVAIHDVGEHEGVPFIAMEYVEGQSLRAFVGVPSPSNDMRLGWMIDVARALSAAHEKGLVHRDIKPDNVMIRDDGTVKVLDFGIARYKEGLPDLPPSPAGTEDEAGDLAMVATSTRVVGTPGYMAPEQTRGDTIDGRADQFSWGVVAFEILSGELPWPMPRGAVSIAAAALSAEPKPLGDDVCPNVAAVIKRALAKSPADRFASMRDLVSALGVSPDTSGSVPALGRPSQPNLAADSGKIDSVDATPPARKPPKIEERGSWVSGRRSTLMVAALLVLMVATVVGARAALHREAASSRVETSAAPTVVIGQDAIITSLPASPTCNAASTALYRDGLALLREANWEFAHAAFTKAAEADPSCPEVQLRRVMTGQYYEPIVKQREHFRKAAELRDSLSARDRVLFDSMMPLIIIEPPDRETSARILETGIERFPRDAELVLMTGAVRMKLALDDAALEHSLELTRRASDIDPRYADAWQYQGRLLAQLGRLDDELSALDACLQASPGASDCMHDRVMIMRWRGQCTTVAQETRRWIARSPSSGSAYWQMALALAEDGASDETIQEAVRQHMSHLSHEHPENRWLHAMARLAAFRGDFEKAEQLATRLQKEGSSDSMLIWHLRPSLLLLDLAEETGRTDRAAAIADQFLQLDPVWTVGDPTVELMSYEPVMLAALLRRGRITTQDWMARAAKWEERVRSRIGPLDSWGFRWGPVSDIRGMALEGWRAIPTHGARSRTIAFIGFDLHLADMQQGRLALAAGEPARAASLLGPASKSCLSFEQPFANTRAHLWLGEAREGTGDKAGACQAYDFVLKRWGAAKPRSKTAEEARRRARALGCGVR